MIKKRIRCVEDSKMDFIKILDRIWSSLFIVVAIFAVSFAFYHYLKFKFGV